ncbi:GGDEF domain-containing protein [Actinoplanes rectilineatus]|uniref:GGDEF domain-containing protein n=1 Tax=Actinoplanes rectilineatus TaxID=113571 RepID=UPI0005F2D813|nr:GGDEF domain-containing protein [Actinoplanes rectilineatus]
MRVLLVAVAWTLLAGALFVQFAGVPDRQVTVFWTFQPPLDALLLWSSWRVTRASAGVVRRFWRSMTMAAALFLTGDTVQAVQSLRTPGEWSTAAGGVQSLCFLTGLGLVIVTMLIHPQAGQTGRERLGFWLDAGSVMVGGAVVAWCFTVGPDTGRADLISTLAAGAVVLTSAFAAVKMILSGNAPLHRFAAVPMIGSAVVNSIGLFLAPDATGGLPAHVYLVRFLPSLLIAVGPRIQELVTGVEQGAGRARRRKPYSLLPYASIAAVFATLLVILPRGVDTRLWGVVAGLGVIIVLVVARQWVAFQDNTRLIRELDTTLTELRRHETRLRRQALFDDLTGLANRGYFHEEVTGALDAGEPVALLLIDLDGFKGVNDTHGHAAGDALLAGVADRLRQSVRSGDLVARLGGDEFGVLLHHCDAGEGGSTADRILGALTAPIPAGPAAIVANASIGVAASSLLPECADVRSLLHFADLAMYEAKHRGKGTWTLYSPDVPGHQRPA